MHGRLLHLLANHVFQHDPSGHGRHNLIYLCLPHGGNTYYFTVEQFDKGVTFRRCLGVVSATTVALPWPPANLTGTAISNVQIRLTWTAAQTGMSLASYRVFQEGSPSNLTELTAFRRDNHIVDPVTPGITHYYGVESANPDGHVSPKSVLAQVTTPN
jgi:hypothetical protein